VVELTSDGEHTLFFIGPCAGGTEIEYEGKSVLILTPRSPLGQQLVGRKQGDHLQAQLGGSGQSYRVAAVS
jgi:transcription elongation GreA/GreB family factor